MVLFACVTGAETAQVCHSDGRDASGFASVDALVALALISTTLIFTFEVLQQARAAADQAWEARQAQTLLADLLERPLDLSATLAGVQEGFRWTLETQPMGAERPVEICRHAARLVHSRSARTYQASTLDACPPAPAA